MDRHTPLMHPDELEHELDLIAEHIGLDARSVVAVGKFEIRYSAIEALARPLRTVH